MPGSMLQRLVLALCATAHVARAAVEASNSSLVSDISYGGHLWLQDDNGANLSVLIPLSVQAATGNVNGTLVLTTFTTIANLTDADIPLINCDPQSGNLQALDIFQAAYTAREINAVIFYSTTSLHCVYSGITEMMQKFAIFSMNSTTDAARVVDQLNQSPSPRFPVRVLRSVTSNPDGATNNTTTGNPNQNPLGPSPSTAVAMIILYSITGIITALFLVIIVTGAVRAHRHPDRYGPRDVLGRPRQSRARGLGRAILDTIPIVKFGQHEPPKPTDVELGSTSEVRDASATGTEPNAHGAQSTVQTNAPAAETPRDAPAEQQETMASGISEAQPAAAGIAATHSDSADDALVCSICTEEFEQGQDIRVLPCNHKFHPDCVDPWLLNVSGTCPLCRVDLRPVTTNDSTESAPTDPDHLAPPLQSSNDLSHRRRTLMRDILSFRTRPDASADERISALRRLREQRRNRSDEGVSASASEETVAAQRRSRLSARLSGVFLGRRRRDDASAERDEPAPATSTPASTTAGDSAPSAPEREQR